MKELELCVADLQIEVDDEDSDRYARDVSDVMFKLNYCKLQVDTFYADENDKCETFALLKANNLFF